MKNLSFLLVLFTFLACSEPEPAPTPGYYGSYLISYLNSNYQDIKEYNLQVQVNEKFTISGTINKKTFRQEFTYNAELGNQTVLFNFFESSFNTASWNSFNNEFQMVLKDSEGLPILIKGKRIY